jgi:dTDP-4-amino-4,6-dideoxygalactose transaminase
MESILAFCSTYGIKSVEDTAQAIGARYSFSDGTMAQAGTMGDVGTTSFFPSKNLGCFGDGGAMFTNNETLAANLQMIANHGQRKKYYHDSIGVNSRLDTLQAAILRVKLKHLNKYSEARNEVANAYDQAFVDHSHILIPVRANNSTHVFHQYTVQLKGVNRDDLKKYLSEEGIPTMVYYPVPLHLQKAYSEFGYKKGDFPVAEDLCEKVLSLPIHTEMKSEEQAYIIDTLNNYF